MFFENSQAILRPFVDTNLNGAHDAGEEIAYEMRIMAGSLNLLHRSSGEIQVLNLQPHKIYPIHISPSSIPDPSLHPLTGFEFAITAPPGRTRYIDISLQPLPVLEGQITGWEGPFPVQQVLVQGQAIDVYRDGGFFMQTHPGPGSRTHIQPKRDAAMKDWDKLTPEQDALLKPYILLFVDPNNRGCPIEGYGTTGGCGEYLCNACEPWRIAAHAAKFNREAFPEEAVVECWLCIEAEDRSRSCRWQPMEIVGRWPMARDPVTVGVDFSGECLLDNRVEGPDRTGETEASRILGLHQTRANPGPATGGC